VYSKQKVINEVDAGRDREEAEEEEVGDRKRQNYGEWGGSLFQGKRAKQRTRWTLSATAQRRVGYANTELYVT
jgi:hypothetical protein